MTTDERLFRTADGVSLFCSTFDPVLCTVWLNLSHPHGSSHVVLDPDQVCALITRLQFLLPPEPATHQEP